MFGRFNPFKNRPRQTGEAPVMFAGQPLTAPTVSEPNWLEKEATPYEDVDGSPVIERKPFRREIDYQLWLDVKRALKTRQFSQRTIAKSFEISGLTVGLIAKSKNLKDYRAIRKAVSRGTK